MLESGTAITIGPCVHNQRRRPPVYRENVPAGRFALRGERVQDQVPTSNVSRRRNRLHRLSVFVLVRYGGVSLSPRPRRSRKEQWAWHALLMFRNFGHNKLIVLLSNNGPPIIGD